LVSKLKARQSYVDPTAGPIFSVRFLIAMLLVVAGIAWIVVYYTQARDAALLTFSGTPKPHSPIPFMSDLKNWNYLIGFGLVFVGLGASAHQQTPLGRGRGVIVGMLGCFLIGLIWICTFYVVSNDPTKIPVMGDLEQYNLLVGIGFMAVGFAFATKWE
jgi:hypothetical protein